MPFEGSCGSPEPGADMGGTYVLSQPLRYLGGELDRGLYCPRVWVTVYIPDHNRDVEGFIAAGLTFSLFRSDQGMAVWLLLPYTTDAGEFAHESVPPSEFMSAFVEDLAVSDP